MEIEGYFAEINWEIRFADGLSLKRSGENIFLSGDSRIINFRWEQVSEERMSIYWAILGCSVFGILLIFSVCGRTMSRRLEKIMFLIFAGLMTIMAAYIIPQTNMDLYRYYNQLERYAAGGHEYLWNQLSKDVQWIHCGWMYLVGQTGKKELLPIVACAACFVAFFYIWFDYTKSTKNRNFGFLECWGLFFVWLPYFQIIDNIRNPISAAICAVCIYLQFYKGKKFSKLIVWYLVSCLIHTQTAVVLLIVLVFMFSKGAYKYRYLLLLIFLTPDIVIIVLHTIPIPYVQFLAEKASTYFSAGFNSILYNGLTISRLCLCVVFLIINSFLADKISKEEKEIFYIIEFVMLFTLGCIRIVTIVRRIPFVLAFLAPIQLDIVRKYTPSRMKPFVDAIIKVSILAMQIFAIGKLTRFSISGINYDWLFSWL